MSTGCRQIYQLRMQVDGGSNTGMLSDPAAARLSELTPAVGSIDGIAGNLAFTHLATSDVTFGASASPVRLGSLFTPNGSKNILSESVLLDDFGIECPKNPPRLTFPDGSPDVPMQRINGLYYVDVNFGAPAAACYSTSIKADDRAILWAARLGLDADGLIRTSKATHGLSLDKLSTSQREAVNSDMNRAIAQSKHAPTSSTPRRDLATEPGSVFILDGFGQHSPASPIDGAVYSFHAVCERTSYGFSADAKTHTVEDWMVFLRNLVLVAKKDGYSPKVFRFDRAPELRTDELKRRVEHELKVLVELGPREHHEAVGRAERNHDLLTRLAEAMLQRARLGTQWLLPARAYAQWLLNRTALVSSGETRYQAWHKKVPDLSELTPYAFGTTVSLVEDVRGPKGSLEHARGSIGRFIGIKGSSYLVYRERRQNVVHQHHVKPLNELALIRSGLPSSVATVDQSTQTEYDKLRQPPPPPPKPSAQSPPPVIDVALGSAVEVALAHAAR